MAIEMPQSPAVQATSLAPVLELASNPPSQPVFRQMGARPLVLYIARVPGSRDVFLTPIKPRDKVVTASDVQSSLYYVHIHTTDADRHSEAPAESPSTDPSDARAPALPPRVQRDRPLPPPLPRRPGPSSSPPYPVHNEAQPSDIQPVQRYQSVFHKPLVPTRSKSRDLQASLPVLPPRPLPPTPPQEGQDVPYSSSLHDDNVRLLRHESHIDEDCNPYVRDYSDDHEALKLLEIDCRPEPGTLTLIRRDPGSNEQWNVATIHDPPIVEVSSSSLLMPTAKRRTKKGGAPLYLDITNPGYLQFNSALSRTESRVSALTRSSSEDSEPPPDGIFRRRLYMPGSKYAEHGYGKNGHRKHASVSSMSSTGNNSETSLPLRGERHSVDMGVMNSSPRADRRSKGYTFTSPWDSQCEFTTGATGKTLKCRHHLPAGIHGVARSVEVSELRFNLPNPVKSTPVAFASRASYFADRPHLFSSLSEDGSQSPAIVIDEEGRIDLSLGQERAGGGMGGKRAKLGKLIIEPDGFGMLDLLVASNIGLWFRAWEKL